jgi:hypothetical protein
MGGGAGGVVPGLVLGPDDGCGDGDGDDDAAAGGYGRWSPLPGLWN